MIDYITAFFDNYIWILINKTDQSAICVDPGEADGLIAYLDEKKLKLAAILLTHHHADHSGGLPQLLRHFPNIKIYGCNDARLQLPGAHPIHEDMQFSVADFHFQVLKTAGHTNSHVCFYETQYHYLFSGDTLFSGGCGRIFDGQARTLYDSLLRLKNLAADTKVFCGHEYTAKNLRFAALVEPGNTRIREHLECILKHPDKPSLPSSIGLEKEINPFLRLDKDEVIQYALSQGCPSALPFDVFKQLRHDKDMF